MAFELGSHCRVENMMSGRDAWACQFFGSRLSSSVQLTTTVMLSDNAPRGPAAHHEQAIVPARQIVEAAPTGASPESVLDALLRPTALILAAP